MMSKIPLFILLISFHSSFENDATPFVIDIKTLDDCEDQKVSPPEGFKCETEIVGEGASKGLNAEVTIPFDIDNDIKPVIDEQYKASVKRWADEKWIPIKFVLTGNVCEHAHKYVPGIWEKLTKVIGIPSECPIKAGSYSVQNFKASTSDVNLPFLVSGKYLVSIVVIDKNDTPITCKQSELTISKP